LNTAKTAQSKSRPGVGAGSPEEMPAALEELKRGVTETGGTWEAHSASPGAAQANAI
jgi:hypothetical protein